MNNLLDFFVASYHGVIDDSTEVSLESNSPFLDQGWFFIGFGPEVGHWEGRQFILSE